MKKQFFSAILGILISNAIISQNIYTTNSGKIRFFSEAPLENIEAIQEAASSILNISTGDIVSMVTIKKFKFEKALMEAHFNDNYMESEKYPHAKLKGKIKDFDKLKFEENKSVDVIIDGELDMHGVKNPVTITGTLKKSGEAYTASSKFTIKLADYNIKIPSVVVKNIAETIDVYVDMNYQLKKNEK
jgi:hypothetical protein